MHISNLYFSADINTEINLNLILIPIVSVGIVTIMGAIAIVLVIVIGRYLYIKRRQLKLPKSYQSLSEREKNANNPNNDSNLSKRECPIEDGMRKQSKVTSKVFEMNKTSGDAHKDTQKFVDGGDKQIASKTDETRQVDDSITVDTHTPVPLQQ